jgi:16S rRNA (uracil1498-N3)-methyltransferase
MDVGAVLRVSGEEAKHAIRVKRLEVGDRVEVCDGSGLVTRCAIAQTGKEPRTGEWWFEAKVEDSRREDQPRPRVEVWSAVAKGDKVEQMIDGLSQVGVARWRALHSARSVVEPREGKMARLERHAVEAMKQCGRAWVLEVGDVAFMEEAFRGEGVEVVMADVSGARYEASGAGDVRVLVGPEGGWTDEELAWARERGARVCRFGRHVMRIEVAAVVAAGVVVERG